MIAKGSGDGCLTPNDRRYKFSKEDRVLREAGTGFGRIAWLFRPRRRTKL